ncbi:hypothetical protein EBM89_05745 [Cellulomonas triticagri]|uniref:Uncharacterized protein n=1 Tax=Cellulomonas triticagri TaxID=2483352 RepID=A0A3M2JJ88_9CELL|nr:hypothetical protein EBM89_05745 [Cellulomonas triticagri]
MGLGVAWVLLCGAAAVSPSVFGVLVAVIAVVVGARAALAAMGWWWSGTGRQRVGAAGRRPGWVWWWADRRTRHERRRTGATAALVATTATVFLYGGAVGRDEAATAALRDMLGSAAVLEVDGPDGAARLAAARTPDGAGAALVVTDHDIALPQSGSCAAGSVSGAGRRVVAGDVASVFAGRVVAGRLPRGAETGVVVTATMATGDGLAPGDSVCVAEGDGWRTAPVVAVVAAPGGLGESFVVGLPGPPAGLSGDATALAVARDPVASELAAAVPQARLTDGGRWVDSLPSGKAFSVSGGSGADEMVLFLLAPVVMAVTAAGAAAATRELERRGTARTLLRLGARPRQHALTAAAAQLIEVVPLLVLGAVVGMTSAAVGNTGLLREMGGRPQVAVPVDQLAAVGAGMGASVLVAGAVALGVARRRARGGGA